MKPKCEESLSKFAYNCDLRHYNLEAASVSLEALTGGLLLFFLGAYVNMGADNTLLNLRRSPGDKQYYIPHGGLFEYVARPGGITPSSSWTHARIERHRIS